ncbi:MAG: hypothetical protein KGQ40_16255, partial [Rhodospirillales bacterium]|nr:hypothetical protein [Rhodospirillales bacterium]
NGATLDVANNMPGSQSVIFGDGAGMLKIEAGKAGKFGAHILGLQTADTIELVGLNGTGDTFSYGTSTTYGHDVLVIQSGATVVAALRIAGDWLDSSGTIGGASTGNFNVTASGTNTFIVLQSATSGAVTVTPTIADWAGFTVSGGTVDWGASGQWTGGSGAGGLPGANQAVDIAMSATEISNFQTHGLAKYTLTINSAESAGSVIFADPAATLVINNTLSLAAPAGGHGGAFFSEQGRVHITGAGTVSATSFLALSPNGLTIDPGGSIGVSGAVPYTTGYGLAGLTLNQGVTITDGTISSGGAIAVGANDLAYAFVQSSTTSVTGTSVTDTYASIGGYNFVNTSTNTASLTITGPKTVWNDTNADASTPYAGSMLVGGGLPALSSATSGPGVKSGGAGVLTVDNSATLNDANFAVLGVTAGSSGSATVQNGARWNIGTAASTPPSGGIVFGTSTISAGQLPWLSVGLGGSGSLQMMGGNVALGAGEASGTYKMAVGVDSGASGFVNMTSTSTLDTGGGPLAIGVSGSGTLDVSDSAAVNVNNGGSVTGINAGLV